MNFIVDYKINGVINMSLKFYKNNNMYRVVGTIVSYVNSDSMPSMYNINIMIKANNKSSLIKRLENYNIIQNMLLYSFENTPHYKKKIYL